MAFNFWSLACVFDDLPCVYLQMLMQRAMGTMLKVCICARHSFLSLLLNSILVSRD